MNRKAKLHRVLLCLCICLFTMSRTGSAAPSTADTAQISPYALPSNDQLQKFLLQSAKWYRTVSDVHQVAHDEDDVLFLDDNQAIVRQIVRLSFDFVRADLALANSSSQGNNAATTGHADIVSPDLGRILELERQTDQAHEKAKQEVETLTRELAIAHGADRARLKVALDDAQSRLGLIDSGVKTVHGLVQFVQSADTDRNHGGDLLSLIGDLSQTVPEVDNPTSLVSRPAFQGATSSLMNSGHDSGILDLTSRVSAERHKLHLIDDMLRLTDALVLSQRTLRGPMGGTLNQLIQSVLSSTLQASDLSLLQKQKLQLDSLNAELAGISPAMVALDKQKVLLEIYRAHLEEWRRTVDREYRQAWKAVIFRIAVVLAIIGMLALFSEFLRRFAERQVHDAGRLRLINITRRFAMFGAVGSVIAAGVASDWKSLATLIGLITAGVAVALQNVILASVGYFLLVGKRGIGIGDRVQFSGITGDVIEMGLLQFQLKEFDVQKRQYTGRIATFSNSFVFVSPATGLLKLSSAAQGAVPEGAEPLPGPESREQLSRNGKK